MNQLDEMKKRRKAVNNALGILLTATDLPNEKYLKALDDFVLGKITLEELDQKVHKLEYIYGWYLLLYDLIKIETIFVEKIIWLSLDQMAELFVRNRFIISRHIRNVFEEGELERKAVVANFATTASGGKTYQVDYYNLDAIISVGFALSLKKVFSLEFGLRILLKMSISTLYKQKRQEQIKLN